MRTLRGRSEAEDGAFGVHGPSGGEVGAGGEGAQAEVAGDGEAPGHDAALGVEGGELQGVDASGRPRLGDGRPQHQGGAQVVLQESPGRAEVDGRSEIDPAGERQLLLGRSCPRTPTPAGCAVEGAKSRSSARSSLLRPSRRSPQTFHISRLCRDWNPRR